VEIGTLKQVPIGDEFKIRGLGGRRVPNGSFISLGGGKRRRKKNTYIPHAC